jgi:3-phenylpropionate/trans-cinnamate dioxygenase ferredoxin subunit
MAAEWVTVARASDIRPGKGKRFSLAGRDIAVFNVGGRFYAIDDTCTHEKASLSEGDLLDTVVECPRHGAQFDLATGRVLSLPAVKDVRAYRVSVEGDEVKIYLE